MNELKIEYISTEDLRPYEKNARKHGKIDIDAIVASIQTFGFDDPIGVWGDDNIIVEGHGRLLAAQRLGMDKVPVIHLDHLSDEERRAYALAHNRTAELSEWDFDVQAAELAGIFDIDMEKFGFDTDIEETVDDEEDESDNPTLKLPPSRVCVCTLSAFGTNSEIFIEAKISEEDAERILKRAEETPVEELAERLREAVNAL